MAEQLVNVHDLVGRCPFATSQKLLAGKWSLLIMHELAEGPVAPFHQRLSIALRKSELDSKLFLHLLKYGGTNILII